MDFRKRHSAGHAGTGGPREIHTNFRLIIMEPINYRNVTEQDYPQVSEMLCGIWQFDKYLKDAEDCPPGGSGVLACLPCAPELCRGCGTGRQDPSACCSGIAFPSLSPAEHKGFEKEARRFLREFSRSGEGRKFYRAQMRTAKYETSAPRAL